MIEIIVLILTVILFILIAAFVIRVILKKRSLFGKPPVPVFYFILAKTFVLVILIFLIFRGLRIEIPGNIFSSATADWLAVFLLFTGIIIIFLSMLRLNKDLMFGLSSYNDHELQTNGIYSVSRHPFYLGFIFVLFSSVLLYPNIFNIIAFIGAWIIHHFIMKKEEEYLTLQYGDLYKQYAESVNRYLTLPGIHKRSDSSLKASMPHK